MLHILTLMLLLILRPITKSKLNTSNNFITHLTSLIIHVVMDPQEYLRLGALGR